MTPAGLNHFIAADGLSLAYADEGEGPVLLCLAGLGRNMDDFETVLNFTSEARVIRLDSRGRGRSDRDANWKNYSIPQESADALALLDHLGIERAAILGTSRGGLIAMGLAAAHRDRLSGAVLVDIGPELAPEGLDYILSYFGHPPGFDDYDMAVRELPQRMAPRFRNVSPDQWRAYARRIWEQTPQGLMPRYDLCIRDAILAYAAEAGEVDLWPLFRAFGDLPLGLIRGANSDLLSSATADRMLAELPHMRRADIPDRGHVPFLDEAPAQSLIADFLKDLT